MTYYIVNGVLFAANICLLVYLFCQARLAKKLNAQTAVLHAGAKAVLIRLHVIEGAQQQ
jgi:hypothetical protein